MMVLATNSQPWQIMFLPIFLIVFWLLFVLKNLSTFRKEFQKIERKDRSTELGILLIKDLKRKCLWRSILGLMVAVIVYVVVYSLL